MSPEQIAKAGTEHAHQAALFCMAAQNREIFPELEWMFAVPNGGERNKIVASKLKAEGVRAGVSDVLLPVSRHGYHGLFIEMKKPGGIASDKQLKFGAAMEVNGYKFVICYTWIEAWVEITDYMVEE